MSNHQKYPELIDFRMWLKEQGVFPKRASFFLKGASEFNKLGTEKDLSKLQEFKQYLRENKIRGRRMYELVKGAEYYVRYLNGEDNILADARSVCNKDCFNCPFPDCIMP